METKKIKMPLLSGEERAIVMTDLVDELFENEFELNREGCGVLARHKTKHFISRVKEDGWNSNKIIIADGENNKKYKVTIEAID